MKKYTECIDCGKLKTRSDSDQRYARCRKCSGIYRKEQNTKKFDICQECGKTKSRSYNLRCRSCAYTGIKPSKETREIWSKQRKGRLPWNAGKTYKSKPRSWEARTNMSNAKTGLKRTVEEYKAYVAGNIEHGRRFKEGKTYESKEWSKKVKERDLYTCQKCGIKTDLESHHILRWATHPEHRLNIDNGVCVCSSCHKKIHSRS